MSLFPWMCKLREAGGPHTPCLPWPFMPRGISEDLLLVKVRKLPLFPHWSDLTMDTPPGTPKAVCIGGSTLCSSPRAQPLLGAPCWDWCAQPPALNRTDWWVSHCLTEAGLEFGSHSGCVVSSGKHLEYVNVSGCWREIYNFSYYWERAITIGYQMFYVI